MTEADGRFADAFRARVPDVARLVVGDPAATIGEWRVSALRSGSDDLAIGGTLRLIEGSARVGGVDRSWRVVLKVLAQNDTAVDPDGITYWPREALLYRAGFLDDLPGGMRAPKAYAVDDVADGVIWLWLKAIEERGPAVWSADDWADAARVLGRFNGAYVAAGGAARALPRASWLGGRRLRTWLDRHHPMVARIAATVGPPATRDWWPRPVVEEILALWDERGRYCDALERLPLALGHGDTIRRNLFLDRASARTVDRAVAGTLAGGTVLTAIDWEFAGHYAPGEEVGQMVSVASAFYDWEPAELPALDALLFDAYREGLREMGWRGDDRAVRFAMTAHAALRNIFNAVGTMSPEDAERNAAPDRPLEAIWNAGAQRKFGRRWDELAQRRAETRPFLLARAAEARRLLAELT